MKAEEKTLLFIMKRYYLIIFDFIGNKEFGSTHGYHSYGDWALVPDDGFGDCHSEKTAVTFLKKELMRKHNFMQKKFLENFKIKEVKYISEEEKEDFITDWFKNEPPIIEKK